MCVTCAINGRGIEREPIKMSRVTLQTIADAVGVSRMTVSNAFSRPGKLSQDLRDRIRAVAEDLGYVGPDPRLGRWPGERRVWLGCCSAPCCGTCSRRR